MGSGNVSWESRAGCGRLLLYTDDILLFVAVLGSGIRGAAIATAIAQTVSGIGVLIYFWSCYETYRPKKEDFRWDMVNLKKILSLSGFACLQQSVMNLHFTSEYHSRENMQE